MTDLLGYPLNVGDEIVYTTGAQSQARLQLGFILEIKDNEAMIRTKQNRRALNWRRSFELLSINPIKENNPELFI